MGNTRAEEAPAIAFSFAGEAGIASGTLVADAGGGVVGVNGTVTVAVAVVRGGCGSCGDGGRCGGGGGRRRAHAPPISDVQVVAEVIIFSTAFAVVAVRARQPDVALAP